MNQADAHSTTVTVAAAVVSASVWRAGGVAV